MKLNFKKICILFIVMAMLVPSFVSTAFGNTDYDADGTIPKSQSALWGSVSITGVHSGAKIKWEHVIVPASFATSTEGQNNTNQLDKEWCENATTRWLFCPRDNKSGYDITKSTLWAFATAYGVSASDYGLDYLLDNSGSKAYNANLKSQFIAFEQAVMQAFIDDCVDSDRLSSTDGSTPSSTIHSSSKFQQALKNLVVYGVLYSKHESETIANGDSLCTIRSNLKKMNIDTGLYVMFPESSGGILYSPTAAFVNFRYANGTGDNQSGDIEGIENVVAHAKSTQLTIDKHVANGEYSYTVGDIVEFNIKSTYPILAPEMYATSIFKFLDSSDQLTYYHDIVVKVGDTTLTEGTDYLLTVDNKDSGTSSFVVKLLDGTADNGKADYNAQLAGKEILISYKARVRELYIRDPYEFYEVLNTATVRFDNYNANQTVKAYTVGFKLQKLEANTNNRLQGAVFVCKRQKDDQYVTFSFNQSINNYVVTGTSPTLTESAKITVGRTNIVGLDGDEVYVLTEIQAPVGYSLSEKKIVVGTSANVAAANILNPLDIHVLVDDPVIIENGSIDEYKYSVNGSTAFPSDGVVYSFPNTSLMALPSTGGWGTYAFTIVGVALVATAIIIIRNKKDKELEETEV